jgi:mono/diheme cytochrome c family protein
MKPDRKRAQVRKPAREVRPPARSRAEDPEPSTVSGSLPVWLFIVLSVMLFWGMLYLDNFAGGFNSRVYQRYTSTNELVALVPFDPAKEQFNKGLAIYGRTCAPCHQAGGQGTPGAFPPLADSEWVLEKDPVRLIHLVLDGVHGPIQVKGLPFNSVMPPWRLTFSDEEVAQVLTYVRQAWGNDADAVNPESVTRIRQATENRSTPWSAEELLQVPLSQ